MRNYLLPCLMLIFVISGCTANVTLRESDLEDMTSYEYSDDPIMETDFVPEITDIITTEELQNHTFVPDIAVETNELIVESESAPEDGHLVRILDYIPDAVIDLRYATNDNFTGTTIYNDPEAYLCYGTVKKLMHVQSDLKEKGFRILIWDAYRSPEAQWKLWESYPDPTFVANPQNGLTSHSRGNTVDISIVYEDGSLVEMPSAFDEFSSVADRDYSDASEMAAKNAQLLENIMYNNGFTGYRGEWWDYSDINTYDLTTDDVEFAKGEEET